MRPCSSMIAGQPCRGSTSILSNSAASGVRRGTADARGARAPGGAEAAAAGVLGDVGGRDAISAGDSGARGEAPAAAHVAAVVPEERAAAVGGVVVAVAVLDDPVGLVDAVGVVVAAARAEGEREDGYGDERDVAGAVATAFRHSASSLSWAWTVRNASTISGVMKRRTRDNSRDSNGHRRRMHRVRVP